MNNLLIKNFNENEVLDKVKNFLKVDFKARKSEGIIDGIKELVVVRLCKSIGIWCDYNYKTPFFEFYSSIVGEAICRKLKINLRIAEDRFRFFKYEHLNLIDEVGRFLDEEIDEATLDCFNFLDRFKYLIDEK